MKKFEYCQIDYFNYPSEDELNKMGEIGWELVCIGASEKRTFYDGFLLCRSFSSGTSSSCCYL